MVLTVLTWNLKGSDGPDMAVVADHVRTSGADVALFQEIQCHQARRLARRLGVRSCRWGFKHWSLRERPEGMAILGITRPVRVRARALTLRWRFWSWRRRIVLLGRVAPDGVDEPIGPTDGDLLVVNVHFSPHSAVQFRDQEVRTVVRLIGDRHQPTIVGGDVNDRPGQPAIELLLGAGLRDSWLAARPGDDEVRAATNWRNWKATRGERPTQRLDYLLASADIPVLGVSSPRFGDDGFDRLATLSDHLPVVATFDLPH